MREDIKESAIAVTADMLEREFQFPPERAERVARRAISVLLPPLEQEVEKHNQSRQTALLTSTQEQARFRDVVNRFSYTIESIINYTRSIEHRRGHYVDVPIDDRTAVELETLMKDWAQMGGLRFRGESRPLDFQWDGGVSREDPPDFRIKGYR